MNSKERVLRTMKRQPVDRIPIGFFAIDADTVANILGHETYLRAKAKSQIALWEGRRDEVVQSWKEDTIELYRKLDFIDIIHVSSMASSIAPPKDYTPEKVRRVDAVTWEADDGRVWRLSDITGDLTLVQQPPPRYRLADFPPDMEAREPDQSVFEVVDAVISEFGDSRFIIGPNGGEAGMILLGDMEYGLMAYALQPDVVRQAIAYHTRIANQLDTWYVRPGSDGILWGNDFSATTGPFMSPKMFREFCLPSIKERVRAVKTRGMFIFKHACGNNWKLLDMFVEAGYDAYQSIQISAGMDLARVKAQYGKDLVLWGGVQVEHLVSGSPDDIRSDVESAMRTVAPGGGYIFGTTHSVAIGTRYKNFMTMLDAYHQWAYKAASSL